MTKENNTTIVSEQNILIADALQEFLLALRAARRSERTIEFYQENVTRFTWWLRKGGYSDEVAEVKAAHFRLFTEYLQKREHRWASDAPQSNRKCSDTTIQAYYRALRAFWNWCDREGFVAENPFASGRLPMPKAKSKVMPSYTPDNIRELIEACVGPNKERDLAIVLLLLDTGIRGSELCGARLGDLERGRLKVLGKGNKERYIALSPPVEKTIRDYIRRERPQSRFDNVFLGKGAVPLERNGLYQLVERRAKLAGVDNPGVHKFRHTFALTWASAGGPIHALQAILGHESPMMSLRYGRMAGEQTAELHRQFSPVERLNLRIRDRRK